MTEKKEIIEIKEMEENTEVRIKKDINEDMMMINLMMKEIEEDKHLKDTLIQVGQ